MSHYDKEYENYAKRIALGKDNSIDTEYWSPILKDAWSQGQIRSKIWLVKELSNLIDLNNKTLFVLGGWIGVLPAILFWHTNVKNIRNFELDEKCVFLSDWLIKEYMIDNFRYKTIHQDMMNIDYDCHRWSTLSHEKDIFIEKEETPDIIINTSCDHLKDFTTWWNLIPKGKTFAIQNNNFPDIDDHHNWIKDLNTFKSQVSDTSEIYYSGELETEKYKRFMIIGRK